MNLASNNLQRLICHKTPTNQPIIPSNQVAQFRALVVKFIQLEPNDWQKFMEELKNLHSAEIQRIETQTHVE